MQQHEHVYNHLNVTKVNCQSAEKAEEFRVQMSAGKEGKASASATQQTIDTLSTDINPEIQRWGGGQKLLVQCFLHGDANISAF